MRADAVVTGERAGASLDALYRTAAAVLGRVFAVCDSPADASVFALQDRHPDLVVLRDEAPLAPVASWNRGLLLRERDVLLLREGVVPAEGCVEEMLAVLHASDRIASVSPLLGGPSAAGLPRAIDLPTARGPCLLLRHAVLNMIGGFDPSLARLDDAQDDWAMRAQRMGLRHVRANHALASVGSSAPIDASRPSPVLLARHPHLPGQIDAWSKSAGSRIAARAGPNREPRFCTDPATGSEECEVLYARAPIEDATALLATLETPFLLVLGRPEAYRSRAILFAVAHAAQAVVAASAQERAGLIAELRLDGGNVEVAGSDAELEALLRRAVDHPDAQSLRYRSLLSDFLRSLLDGTDAPSGAVKPPSSPRP